MMRQVLLLAFGFLFLGVDLAGSQTPLPSGEEVIKKSKDLLYEIEDQKNKVILKLVGMDGSRREIIAWRYWKNYNDKDGFDSKTVVFTESPPDLRGQAFLIWDYSSEGKSDDLWIYLPTLRMTRRIQPRQQDDAFMGSDLTFADMGQRRLDEDHHQILRIENYRGIPCFVLESVPKEKESLYSKRVTWISQNDYTIQKIDYYDQKGDLLKRQTIDWQTVIHKENNVYVWKRTDVVNVQNGHKTVFEVTDLRFNIGLSDEDFTERVLTGGLRK